jgi:CHAT domain-containing protein
MRKAPLFLLLALAGCSTPPPSAQVTTTAEGATGLDLGRTAAGETCRLMRSGTGGDVFCGEWSSPSARIRAVAAPDSLSAARTLTGALVAQLDCGAPRATQVLGGQPAALLECRRRNGGWPAFALAAESGGRVWQADGVLPALPAAERAIGVLSGRLTAEAAPPPSGAIDQLAARLAREAFATGDISRYEQLMAVGRDANQAERFVAAETAYRAALALQERVPVTDPSGRFTPMVLLALQLSNQGRYPEAEALLTRAATLAPRAADPLAPAMLAHYQGLHAANRGRDAAALAALAQAADRYGALVPPEQRAGRLAPVSSLPGLDLAGLAMDPIAARAMVGLVEARRNRAAVLRALGRFAEATAEAEAAQALAGAAPGAEGADLIAARLARTGGAAAAAAGQLASADASFARSALRFARGVPRSRPYAETLLLRAAQQPVGQAALTAELCREAVAVLRGLREGTTATRIAPCMDAFMARGATAEAFEAAQLSQGSVTTTQIATAAARLTARARDPAVAAALQAKDAAERALTQIYRARDAAVAAGATAGELAAFDRRITEGEDTAVQADAAVQSAAPGFAQLVQSVASAEETLAVLRPGEALALSSIPPQGRGWSFVLLDGGITAAPVGSDGAAIAALVARVRAGVESGSGDKPFDAAAAHELYRALFGGVAATLDRATALVAVAEGPMLSLPYGLLVTAPPAEPRGHVGAAFLLERLPVAHVPAPASLVALRRVAPSQAPRPWIGFGAPRPVAVAYAARSFPAAPECGQGLASLQALRGAEVELQAAALVTGSPAAARRTGAAFTADAVRQADLRSYRTVHFATHGVLPSELSCLTEPTIIASTAATGPDATQALITSGTILDLQMDANLVMLSACNSGGGIAAGESLSTLARAFFFAGARSLMVTHWYVDDIAAARVGVLTLEAMQAGDTPAAALRKAQLAQMRIGGGTHPAQWAPFALIGAGSGS